MIPSFGRLIRRLHGDEDGKLTVEAILLIAFITLPLLGVLIAFRNQISEFLQKAWQDLVGKSGGTNP